MPISMDSAKVSVDFPYEWETPNGDKVTVNMRFLHTEDGPVVQIFNGPMEPIALPAMMFLEVSEFLIKQNVMKGLSSNIASTPRVVGGVTMPNITRKAKDEVPTPRLVGQRTPRPEVSIEPVSSINPPEETEESEVESTTETAEITQDSANVIAERMRVRAQANIEKNKEKRVKPR